MSIPNEIRREITFQSNRERVWSAITNPARLEQWFGTRAEFKRLAVGEPIIFGWESEVYQGVIAEVDPPRQFAYRWDSLTANIDAPFNESLSTLVTFTLHEVADGTRLTLVESGFAALPDPSRSKAFQDNDSGWNAELEDLQAYLGAWSS
jgi:uncharacterized protein YndB with AHSA1/START domain